MGFFSFVFESLSKMATESKALEEEYKNFPDGELKRLMREGTPIQRAAANNLIKGRTERNDRAATLKSLEEEYKNFSNEKLEKLLRVGNSDQMNTAQQLLRRRGVEYSMETIKKIRAA